MESSRSLLAIVRVGILCSGLFLPGSIGQPLAFAQEVGQARSEVSANQTSAVASDSDQAKPDDSTSQQAEPKTKQDKKKSHRGSFVAAPLPIVSPAIGAGVVPVVGYIFALSEKDKVSPPSLVRAGGLWTDNGSNGFGIGTQLFMKENRYEIQALFADGTVNYTLFGEGFFGADPGAKLPISQTGRVFFGEPMRNVGHKIFIGPRVWIGTSTVTLRNNGENVLNLPDIGLHTKLVSLGAVVVRDTRPDRFYPLTGSYVHFSSDFFAQALGSKYSFQSYRFTFSKYGSLSERQVLAYNLFLCGTGGSPPFYGNCIYGHSRLN
jgi:hypothetical protein